MSLCQLHGSNMAADPAAQAVERLQTLNFGVVLPVTIIYPINFFLTLPEDAI